MRAHHLQPGHTAAALDLSGGQLVLILLGFNLDIMIMQPSVGGLVLPVLVVIARVPAYSPLQVVPRC